MKASAYFLSAGLIATSLLALAACSDDSSGGSAGAGGSSAGTAGSGDSGKGGSAGSKAGTGGTSAGTDGEGGTSAGTNGDAGTSGEGGTNAGSGGTDPFGPGGGGTAGTAGTAGTGNGGTAGTGNGGSNSGGPCTTQECFDQCIADNPDGADDFNAFYNCIGSKCAEPCGSNGDQTACGQCQQANCATEGSACQSNGACADIIGCINGQGSGGSGGSSGATCDQVNFGSEACNTCARGNCCAETEACFSDDDCQAFNQCLVDNNCTDQACAQNCANQHQSGAGIFQSLSQCIQDSCATECQ